MEKSKIFPLANLVLTPKFAVLRQHGGIGRKIEDFSIDEFVPVAQISWFAAEGAVRAAQRGEVR